MNNGVGGIPRPRCLASSLYANSPIRYDGPCGPKVRPASLTIHNSLIYDIIETGFFVAGSSFIEKRLFDTSSRSKSFSSCALSFLCFFSKVTRAAPTTTATSTALFPPQLEDTLCDIQCNTTSRRDNFSSLPGQLGSHLGFPAARGLPSN